MSDTPSLGSIARPEAGPWTEHPVRDPAHARDVVPRRRASVALVDRLRRLSHLDAGGRRVADIAHYELPLVARAFPAVDDELRLRIARAIYGNPSFWHYASMANPPIHIVVDQGRVKLEGTVNNHVERMLAQSLAIGFGEFSVENALKTDAERQVELEQID